MTEAELIKLKYPIGHFERPKKVTKKDLELWVETIQEFPKKLSQATIHLQSEEKGWVYRPGGWSIRQLVHHCADSHMNSFIRFKLTLTEDEPTIKPYLEDKWAELSDVVAMDIDFSLSLLTGLHARWAQLLKTLTPLDLKRQFVHPEMRNKMTLEANIALYDWHCRHHLAHIQLALTAKGKYNQI